MARAGVEVNTYLLVYSCKVIKIRFPFSDLLFFETTILRLETFLLNDKIPKKKRGVVYRNINNYKYIVIGIVYQNFRNLPSRTTLLLNKTRKVV